MQNNQAAFILAADNSPLQVGPGPDQSHPAEDEVVVQVAAVAINPSEWKMKELGYLPLKYPHVLGSDVAGTVVKVGEEVKRFKAGDRVIGQVEDVLLTCFGLARHCLGLLYGGAKHGGFQNFTTLREAVTAPIPDGVRFEEAVVLPWPSRLRPWLRLPSADPVNVDEQKNKHQRDEAVLIWGAASSMGTIAVQLAVAAGYAVITTASTKNHDYVRALTPDGGRHVAVFDYRSPSVAGDIIDRIKDQGLKFAGAYDCIGLEESTRACAEVVHAFGGGVLPSVLWPPQDLPSDVEVSVVNAIRPGTVAGSPGSRVWREYVPKALANGSLRLRPEPEIVGTGLDRIEEALNLHKAGVSAKKLVVLL
ncbi:alcohol dehydrogenase [Apiospora hydei]|uniref:Alcohol dehydrogenase n=1 Tax=Apiospora hydei TaxID=1337664 RepID=A0ABR1VYP3_9PEZI